MDLLILDLDGVIVDSEPLSAAALMEELAAIGAHVTEEEIARDFTGRSFVSVAAALRARIPHFPEDFEARYRARLFAAFDAHLEPTPGVVAALDRIRAPMRIATSSTPVRAERALRATSLWERFGTCVDTASEVPNGKPAPDLFLLSARRGGADPAACVVVEDSAPGLEAAAAAGIPSILYLGGAHRRGRPWDGPPPSLGTMQDWAEFEALIGRAAA